MLPPSDFHGFKTTAETAVLVFFFLHINVADRLEHDIDHICIRKHINATGTDLWNANIWAEGHVSSFSAQGFRLAPNRPSRLHAYQCLEHTRYALGLHLLVQFHPEQQPISALQVHQMIWTKNQGQACFERFFLKTPVLIWTELLIRMATSHCHWPAATSSSPLPHSNFPRFSGSFPSLVELCKSSAALLIKQVKYKVLCTEDETHWTFVAEFKCCTITYRKKTHMHPNSYSLHMQQFYTTH